MSAALVVIRRDLRLAFRYGFDSLMALLFFVLAVILFPFGVGPEAQLLGRIAGGVIWVAALLAALLALDRLFQADYEDGTLDLLALGSAPLFIVAFAKIAAHWLITGIPLLMVAPVLALILHLDGRAFGALIASLALGTPVLSLVGGVGAALVLGARRAGVLLALLVLPLYIPVLIFGVAAVDAAGLGFPVRPHLWMLGGFLLMAVVLAPWAAAAALRQALD
ncbi:MAG: heme exporter protein CcmB [Rhodospirillales bacterium]